MTELIETNAPASVFFALTKVDPQKREVWGRATEEKPDHAREIMDYQSSVPNFKAWSASAKARTSGVEGLPESAISLGNMREMHQPIAAGKVISIDFNDMDKAIDIGTYCSDDDTWKKILNGTYTGFSIGGTAKRWMDPSNPSYRRYTAQPAEISYVDSPALPSATFKLIKADGSEELRKIGEPMDAPESETPPVDEGHSDADEGDEPPPTSLAVIAPTTPPVLPIAVGENNVPVADFLDTSAAQSIQVTPPPPVVDIEKTVHDFLVAGESLQALIKAVGEEGAQESKLKVKGEVAGIARRTGEPLTPPKDYPSDSDKYADPANHKWPVDSPARAKAAQSYFNAGDGKDKYSETEWATLGRRIASRASAQLGVPHHYDASSKTIDTITSQESKKMETLNKADLASIVSRLQDGLSVAASQIESDPAGAQAMLVTMLSARQGQTMPVNPANPVGASPTNDPSNATTVLKADAVTDPNQSLLDKLDALLVKLNAAPAVQSSQQPIGDLSALIGTPLKAPTDPVIEALTSGDRHALYKAAVLAGSAEAPDVNAVYQKIDQELNKSLKAVYTNQLIRSWYNNSPLQG